MTETENNAAATEIGPKQAIKIATEYVRDLFSGEGGRSPTLEEVWYEDLEHVWSVTVGIRHRNETVSRLTFETRRSVDYKTVRVSAKDGKVLSVKLHESAA